MFTCLGGMWTFSPRDRQEIAKTPWRGQHQLSKMYCSWAYHAFYCCYNIFY